MRLASLSVCVLGLLVSCNDGNVDVNTNQDNVCDEIAEVACHNLYQCCTEGEVENFLNVSEPRTELQCRDDVVRACTRGSATLHDSIVAGRVTFNAQTMNDCLNSIVAPEDTCASVVSELPWTEACKDSAWVGTVALGGDCFFAHDCAGAPDNFCAPNQKCTAKPTAGLPCGTGCASAFYCGVGGICAPKLSVGAPCTLATQCATDLYCDVNALPVPACAAKGDGGAACSANLGCISGTCIPGQCMGTTQTCYRDVECFARCAGTGAYCTTSANCGLGTCSVEGTSCSSAVTCTAVGSTCVFPVLCLPGDCIGEPVCTNQTLTVDYCTAAGQVPII